jgi:CRAL/TRIO domain
MRKKIARVPLWHRDEQDQVVVVNDELFDATPTPRRRRPWRRDSWRDPLRHSSTRTGTRTGTSQATEADEIDLESILLEASKTPLHSTRTVSTNKPFSTQTISIEPDRLDLPDWALVDTAEGDALLQTKALLKDDLHKLNQQTITIIRDGSPRTLPLVQAFPDVYGDFRLLRFLRKDKPANPHSAAQRFKSFLTWRQSNDIDAIRAKVETKPFAIVNPLINDYMPCEFHHSSTQDATGKPMRTLVLPLYNWQPAQITKLIQSKQLSMQDFKNHWTMLFESLHYQLYNDSMDRRTMLYVDEVINTSNIKLMQFTQASFVQQVATPWISWMQANYPETTKRIVVYNPPGIIKLVWNIVTKLVSPGTVAKVQLVNEAGPMGEYLQRQASSKPLERIPDYTSLVHKSVVSGR